MDGMARNWARTAEYHHLRPTRPDVSRDQARAIKLERTEGSVQNVFWNQNKGSQPSLGKNKKEINIGT